MAHFLCHLGCSHFGALLLDFYFTENTIERGRHACSLDLIAQIALTYNKSLDYLVLGKTSDVAKTKIEEVMAILARVKCEL